MTHFPMVMLDEFCEINIGRTPSRNVRDYWGAGAPWLSIADMNQGRNISVTKEQITEPGIRDANMRLVPKGTILLSFKLSIGKVSIAQVPLYTNEAIAALPIKQPERLLPEYLYWCIKAIDLTVGQDRAAMGLTLNKAKLAQLQIPLPPITIQRRIAAILDQADALRAKRRKALAQLDSLKQSIFIEMFGDPATNSMSWPVKAIEQLCEVKGGKRLPKGADYSASPTPFRYVRVTNLSDGRVDESNLLYLTPEVQRTIARYIVNTGDVIISIAGSIGLIAAVPQSLNGANLTENAAKLVARTKNSYLPDFLAFMLRMTAIQSQIDSHVGQVTIGKLALFRIEKLLIPLPPLSLQQIFATRIQFVESLKATQRDALSELEALFASLQHRAFRGEL